MDIAVSSLIKACRGLLGKQSYIIATCTLAHNIPSELKSSIFLGEPISLPPLDAEGREKVFRSMLCDDSITVRAHRRQREEGKEPHTLTEVIQGPSLASLISNLAQISQGCSHGDLVKLLHAEYLLSTEAAEGKGHRREIIADNLLDRIIETRSALGGLGIEGAGPPPPTTPQGLVGLEAAQGRLHRVMQGTIFMEDAIKKESNESSSNSWKNCLLSCRPCSGVLLHGPHGSGKSALIQWLTSQAGPRFQRIEVPCADLVHKVVGESEKRLQSYFQAARKVAPAILVLDNIDIHLWHRR